MNHRLITPAILAGIGTASAIGILAALQDNVLGVVLLMAPFGATAVLLFGITASPLAQPKNVILGHLITALIGVCFVQWAEINALTLALATGLSVFAMLITGTTHPPAGANPIVIMLSGAGWSFLLFPVFIGAVGLVVFAKGYQKAAVHIQERVLTSQKLGGHITSRK